MLPQEMTEERSRLSTDSINSVDVEDDEEMLYQQAKKSYHQNALLEKQVKSSSYLNLKRESSVDSPDNVIEEKPVVFT